MLKIPFRVFSSHGPKLGAGSKDQAWRLRKHGSCVASETPSFARQIDVDKDRVRPQLGAKTQARLALGGGTDDLYLTFQVIEAHSNFEGNLIVRRSSYQGFDRGDLKS